MSIRRPPGRSSPRYSREERDHLVLGHVFGDVGEQDRLEAGRLIVFGGAAEFIRRERDQAARPRRPHAVLVGVDADALSAEMLEVATDAAADVEREPRLQPPQVPAEQRLHAQQPLPRGVLQAHQPLRVVFADCRARRLVRHGVRHDNAQNASRPASACANAAADKSAGKPRPLWDVNYDDVCISYRAAEILRFRVAAPSMTAPATLGDVKRYWSTHVNDIEVVDAPVGSPEFLEELERYRYEKMPYLRDIVRSPSWRGKRVLEIGCGPGMDLIQLAGAGARVTGMDLTPRPFAWRAVTCRFASCPAASSRGTPSARRSPMGRSTRSIPTAFSTTPSTRSAPSTRCTASSSLAAKR